MKNNRVTINPAKIACILGLVALFLIAASIGGQLFAFHTLHRHFLELVGLFFVDSEHNVPAGYSTCLLLLAAAILVVITLLERKKSDSPVFYWAVLACGFFCMAVDEALAFHERLIRPVAKLLGDDIPGIFHFAWVVPGLLLTIALALFFARFLYRLPSKTRLIFVLSAILYIGGAIGFELVGGRFAALHGTYNLAYTMIATVEESLEMAGVILFIWALLAYIADNYEEVRFRFKGRRED